MAVAKRHGVFRWAVVVAVVAVVGGAVVPRAVAEPALPPKTAQQLLADLRQAESTSFSGTVESRTDLGLPPLPVGQGQDFAALTSGTHTLRVWKSGREKSRVSLMGDAAEATIIRNGAEVWQWSSATRTATHGVKPARGAGSPTEPPRTPQEAATTFLGHIEPTTTVSVSQTAKVAGRPAYELVLDPKAPDTLVAKVTIAVDAQTNTPLRVEVWPVRASEPAIRVGFTKVDFATPKDEVFAFTPPAGVTLKEAGTGGAPDASKRATGPEPTIVGDGWDQVTVSAMPKLQSTTDPSAQRRAKHTGDPADWKQLVENLPTVSGPWGSGRVLTGSLFTAVITDDGRVAVGMVPSERVIAAIPR